MKEDPIQTFMVYTIRKICRDSGMEIPDKLEELWQTAVFYCRLATYHPPYSEEISRRK